MTYGAQYGLILRTLAAASAAFALAACGAEPPAPTPTATPEAQPTSTAEAQPDSAASSGGGWRADIAPGPRPGDRATDAEIALADGSFTTIEAAAAGRSVLLYFFATW